jgi:signal transduction histidine kinase
MTLRLVLLAAWLVIVVAPLAWWWWHGRAGLPAAPVSQPVGQPVTEPVTEPEAEPGLARRHRRLVTLVPLLQHEIRAGLQGVLGQLTLLEDEVTTDSARRSLSAARREAGRLIELVDGAEMLVRVGRHPPPRAVLPAATVLAEAAADRAEVSVAQAPPGVLVEVCDWQIIRAVSNLVDNALRHGRPPVCVDALAEADSVLFRVLDSGPGLDPAELNRLCRPFTRGPGAGPGTGLGLTVAAEVLAGHGSELETVPGGVGFRLPRFHL